MPVFNKADQNGAQKVCFSCIVFRGFVMQEWAIARIMQWSYFTISCLSYLSKNILTCVISRWKGTFLWTYVCWKGTPSKDLIICRFYFLDQLNKRSTNSKKSGLTFSRPTALGPSSQLHLFFTVPGLICLRSRTMKLLFHGPRHQKLLFNGSK